MASHIYWRVLFTKSPGAPKARNISRLQMHPIVSGINLCVTGNGQVSALTEAKPSKDLTFVAYNAVNNNPLADWMSEKISDSDWIKWAFNIPREILEIQLTASNNTRYVGNAPQDFQLQWSDNDVDWNTSFTVLGEINWIPGEHRRYSQEILRTTIGQAYTKALAFPSVPFTDHLLAVERDTSPSVTIHRNKVTPFLPAVALESAQSVGIKATQYVQMNQGAEVDSPLDMTVKVTVVLIEPTVEASGATTLLIKKCYCPVPERDHAYPISITTAKARDECDCAFSIDVHKSYTIPITPADWEDTAYSITHAASKSIGQGAETETAHSISRGVIDMALDRAVSYNEAFALNADKEPQFSGAVSLTSALSLKYARRIALSKAIERDTALQLATTRVVQLGVAAENDESLPGHISRVFSLGTAVTNKLAAPFSIKRDRILHQSAEKDSGLSIRGARDFPYSQAGSLSSASAFSHSTGVQLTQAIERSSATAIIEPQKILLGVAVEKDARISMFQCPIFEADSAYSIERGFPNIVQTASEADTSSGSQPEKIVSFGQSSEEDVSSGSRYARVGVLGQAAEFDFNVYNWITPTREVSISQAATQPGALPANEVKSNIVGPSAERNLALRVFPPFSGILGIGRETEDAFPISPFKVQGVSQASEENIATAMDSAFSRELGVALESDIARLYDHFNVVRLELINAPSSGIPIDPLRTVVLGQAASKDDGSGGIKRDRDIQVRLARTKGEASSVYIHVADQFNQAVEAEVGLYVNAVKSKALKLAAEDDSAHVLTKILKTRGFNVGSEKDTALAVRSAFAHDFNPSAEKNTAGSMSALKTAILRYADDGQVAYALDKFLKVQGLNPAPELDVALVPTANLSKELKRAFEYDEALKNDAARVKFLRQVVTNEVSYALGQSLKRVLIKQIVSAEQGAALYDTGVRRNTWHAMLPMHRELQFELEIDREAPFEAQVAREAVFRTEI